MTVLWAARALLPDGFADAVRLEVDEQGDLVTVETGVAPEGRPPADDAKPHGAAEPAAVEHLGGVVLPGMANLHSHAFQRAMAGLAERLAPGEASFWTWREVMYRFLARIGPGDLAAIAAQLQVEMLEAGYTALGEFHYLHHQPDGRPYPDPAAMANAILAARQATGIGLTLLPVLYMTGGFGGHPPEPGQRRFVHDLDRFAALLHGLASATAGDPDLRLGMAPHSLRAVPDGALADAIARLDAIDPTAPIHIHVAEQAREVRDCLAWCGRRPVEHLLEIAPVGARWCLIHATHMAEAETEALARSGAVAGLCPTTEANLGDGLFDLALFLDHGGRFGIGSDSHVSISPIEELRWLEYGQRASMLRRLVAASEAEPHCGARLFRGALAGGAQALGRPIGALAPGHRADLIHLDADHPILFGATGEALLDRLVFSGNVSPVRDVMVGGHWRVHAGRHPDRAEIASAYRATLRRLLD
jgi:formimidoylglutamate deiminase